MSFGIPSNPNHSRVVWMAPSISEQGQQKVEKVFEGDGLKAHKIMVLSEGLFPCPGIKASTYLHVFA